MSTESYDLLVIGAGPGGYPAAIRGAQLGLKTACIEREKAGGVCLNWGCIPSKALLKTAELRHKMAKASEYGLEIGEVAVNFEAVIDRSRGVAARFEKGVNGLFKKYGVTVIQGDASLESATSVKVRASDGSEQTLTARHVILATGARARTFPSMVPDGERIVTYREFIVATTRPNRITILGAGAIGMEFAYFLNAMGTEVTVVEGQDEVLPLEEADAAAVVRKSMAKDGVQFVLGQRVQEVRRDGEETVTVLEDGTELRADQTLLALGIHPNTDGIGLDGLGVHMKRGFVEVDANCQTNLPGLYAVGDMTTRGGLAHTATAQAHMTVERLAGHSVPDVDYTNIPSCTYCQPQVASVGQKERELVEQGVAYRVGRFPFLANGKAQGAGDADGFVKVLIDEKYGEILGATIVGHAATEMIAEFVLARSSESTSDVILHTVHAHPTYSEAMLEAVAQAEGSSVHI